jgi:hypothetical protein
MNEPLPRKLNLWRGAILGGIVNATMTAQNSRYAVYAGWHNALYVVQNLEGEEGAVAFERGHKAVPSYLVGAFQSVNGDRWHGGDWEWELDRLFRGCPPLQRTFANKSVLSHLALEHMGKHLHRVTAAFWDDGEYIMAPDPWDELLANGVDVIEIELIEDVDAALRQWQENFQMSEEQVTFSRSLFERKVANPGVPLALSPPEVQFLALTFQVPRLQYEEMRRLWESSQGCKETRGTMHAWWEALDPKVEAEKAMRLCREAFAAMGITVPGDKVEEM